MKAISKMIFFANHLKRQLLHAKSLTKLVHFCKIMKFPGEMFVVYARVYVWISMVGNPRITESDGNSLYDSSTSVSNEDFATRISRYNEKRCKYREFCKS